MNKNFLKVQFSAAPFQCPLAPFTQQLFPAFGRIADMDFFPEGLFLSSKAKAAAFFDASVDTLDEWIAKGLITPYKRGRVYFFPIAGLAQAMNDPRIMAFVRKKALEKLSGIKRKKPVSNPKINYWVIPIPGSKLLFLLIRHKGIYISCPCTSAAIKDEKFRKAFIAEIISLFRLCLPLKSSSYEKI
jgi:hypothetical protein